MHSSPLKLVKLTRAKDTALTNGKENLVQVDELQFQIVPHTHTHTELTRQQMRCRMITLADCNLLGNEGYSQPTCLKNTHG